MRLEPICCEQVGLALKVWLWAQVAARLTILHASDSEQVGIALEVWLWAQVAARLARLHAAGLLHGGVSAETVLLSGPAGVQLLGACSPDSLPGAAEHMSAGQQPLCNPEKTSLEVLTSLWCTRKVSLQLIITCVQWNGS